MQILKILFVLLTWLDLINGTLTCHTIFFAYIKDYFFRLRLNILIFLPILGWKFLWIFLSPSQWSQHFNARYRNIVATYCDMLQHVGCCWLEFENGQIFHATFVNVERCCSRLARFVQQWCAWTCALVWYLTRNRLQESGKTRSTCCAQQCCDLLRSSVAIVWPELQTAGPTMLGYVALRCCYRSAGALDFSVWHFRSIDGVEVILAQTAGLAGNNIHLMYGPEGNS